MSLLDIGLRALALLVAVTIHEFSHALVADRLGDSTPRQAGRLTLNPLRHLDPLGTIMLILFRFGWGKPVPVNGAGFRNPRKGMMYVSLAGPVSNFIVAYIAGQALTFTAPQSLGAQMLVHIAVISIVLGVFNLIPIPPLDGSKVLAAVLPERLYSSYMAVERYGVIILFLTIYLFGQQFFSLMSPIFSFVAKALL